MSKYFYLKQYRTNPKYTWFNKEPRLTWVTIGKIRKSDLKSSN